MTRAREEARRGSIEEPALLQIVVMLVVGGLRALHLVIARCPCAEVDHLASLGAERTKAISGRQVGRLFADGTRHRELPGRLRKLSDERALRNEVSEVPQNPRGAQRGALTRAKHEAAQKTSVPHRSSPPDA